MTDYIPSFYRYVSSITVTSGGSGYNNIPTISITGGGGSGATATAAVSSGAITTITVTNIGTGFTADPTLTITPHASDTSATGAVATVVLDAAQGDIQTETRNTSFLIEDQFPEYVREEYPTFVTFLKKYYEFMDQNENQSDEIINYSNDIDYAQEAFLDKWRGALVNDFPKSLKVNKRFFYKRAKDFYEAKGNKESIETFFRLLYGENVEVQYPSKYILKPSDAYYSVEQSVKMQEADHGGLLEPLTLPGKKIDIRYYGSTGSVTSLYTQDATVTRIEKNSYSSKIDGQTYDLILNFDSVVTEVIGPGAGAVGTPVISSGGIASITVSDGGAGYDAIPTIQIYGDGTGATATATVLNGAVTAITVTAAGSGYTSAGTNFLIDGTNESSDIRTYVVDDKAGNTTADIYGYLLRQLTSVTFKSYSGSAADAGFKVGQIYKINETGDDGKGYAEAGDGTNGSGGGYFYVHTTLSDNYVVVGQQNNAFIRVTSITTAGLPSTFLIINPGSGFLNDCTDIVITSPTGEAATIEVCTGYLFDYEGKWKDDRGKLSDVNKLQDNKRYQPYAYVIKSGTQQTVWDRAIRDTVHPAGMQVFGDLVVKSVVDFSIEFEVSAGAGIVYYKFFSTDTTTNTDFVIKVSDIIIVPDSVTVSEAVTKNPELFKTETLTVTPVFNWNFGLNKSETGVTSDAVNSINTTKGLSEQPSIVDVLIIGHIVEYADTGTASDSPAILVSQILTDSITSVSDSAFWTFGLNKSETTSNSDTINSINTNKGITDTPSATEAAAQALSKPAIADSSSAVDTGIGSMQNYVDPTYLSEDYVGEAWSFT